MNLHFVAVLSRSCAIAPQIASTARYLSDSSLLRSSRLKQTAPRWQAQNRCLVLRALRAVLYNGIGSGVTLHDIKPSNTGGSLQSQTRAMRRSPVKQCVSDRRTARYVV